MTETYSLWVAAVIIYAGLVVSFFGTIFSSPAMGIFLFVFALMAVVITRALMDLHR